MNPNPVELDAGSVVAVPESSNFGQHFTGFDANPFDVELELPDFDSVAPPVRREPPRRRTSCYCTCRATCAGCTNWILRGLLLQKPTYGLGWIKRISRRARTSACLPGCAKPFRGRDGEKARESIFEWRLPERPSARASWVHKFARSPSRWCRGLCWTYCNLSLRKFCWRFLCRFSSAHDFLGSDRTLRPHKICRSMDPTSSLGNVCWLFIYCPCRIRSWDWLQPFSTRSSALSTWWTTLVWSCLRKSPLILVVTSYDLQKYKCFFWKKLETSLVGAPHWGSGWLLGSPLGRMATPGPRMRPIETSALQDQTEAPLSWPYVRWHSPDEVEPSETDVLLIRWVFPRIFKAYWD